MLKQYYSFSLSAITALLLGLSPQTHAAQQAPADIYLVSVGSQVETHKTPEWAEAACTRIHERLLRLKESHPSVLCVSESTDLDFKNKVSKAKLSSTIPFHIILRESPTPDQFTLRVENLKPADDTDFEAAQWDIQADNQELQNQKIQKHLLNVFAMEHYRRPLRELILMGGIRDSERVAMDTHGNYYDIHSFRLLPFEKAYSVFKEENEKQKHYLRATIQLAAILGLSTLNYYYIAPGGSERDWEYKANWENVRKRLTLESFRFDDNSMPTNRGHALAGTVYYWVARSNQLSSMESFLAAFTSSAVWEFLCEYREKPSINDQIITPVGGIAIGESLYQLGNFFNSGKNNWINKILGSTFGGPQAFNAWLDGKKLRRARETDEFGFPTNVWHKFELSVGGTFSERRIPTGTMDTKNVVIGAHTQILNSSDYEHAAQVKRVITDTVFSEVIVNAGYNAASGPADMYFAVKNVLAGYYNQETVRDEKDRLNGYTYFVGPSVGLEYKNTGLEAASQYQDNDWYLLVNVLGATLDVAYYVHGAKIRFNIDVHGDFAMMRSNAFPLYKETESTLGMPSVLVQKGYYYGAGGSAKTGVSLELDGFEAGSSIKYSYIDSIQGWDRFQEEVTQDPHMRDQLLTIRNWIGIPLYKKRVKAVIAHEYYQHQGDINVALSHYRGTERSQRYSGNIVFLF